MAFHVALDLIDGGHLVNGFDKAKRFFELTLPSGVRAKSVAARFHACAIKFDQVDCELAHGLASAALSGSPFGAAHLAQNRRLATNIRCQQVELVGWHVQGVTGLTALARCVFNQKVFTQNLLFADAIAAGNKLFETTDAVHLVHYIIARLER